jgi:integrase
MKKIPSAKQVENWKTPGRHAVGFGLYLQIAGEGGRSWIFRYQHNGRARHVGLGSVAEVTLAQARDRALTYRRALRDEGIDPLARRAAARTQAALDAAKSITFQECAERYIAAHEAAWRNSVHRKQWSATLAQYVYPVFGDLPVATIDTTLVTQALEPIWTSKTETASRIRGRIELVLDWAKARGYRTGENPARWKGHLKNLFPARKKIARTAHHVALPYDELPAFMAALRTHAGVSMRALEFTILTACRSNEVLGARWQEFDLDAAVWTVPADRMKAGKEHRVPLSKQAMAILAALPRESEFVFSSHGKRLHKMVMLKAMRRIGDNKASVHGFRSSFADWSHEHTAFPKVVIDMALAHTVGDKVEAAYRRGDLFDKRRRLMNEWSRACDSQQARLGDVVTLRK